MTLRITAGLWKGRLLKTPRGPTTRPTQGMLRQAVFNICQNKVQGARFLDLFAGSGAMSFEALSRGAAFATLVEKHRDAIACIKENIRSLHTEATIHLIPLDVYEAILKLSPAFELIYIDPPYDSPTGILLEQLLAHKLLAPGAVLFVEERYLPERQIDHSKAFTSLFRSSSLQLRDSRRFGSTVLHQYQMSPT